MFSLDPSLFANDNVTFQIWQYMQNFANTAMVIIFLVIVISQLTGYGIDNYGIKRMLPKLILMAILINLSYIICQLAVDVSNIVGSGVVGISKDIMKNVGNTNILEAGFGGLLTALFGAGAAAGAAAPVIIETITIVGAGGLWWIVPILFVLVIAIVSLIVFFLMLGARSLLAVALVVVSPLAFACYILPNTQTIFKKWLEAFKAVIIVYPIMGGLFAISRLLRVIALSVDGVHLIMVMVAYLCSFAPFLAAPMILKKALNAFGDFGSIISRMGDRAKMGVRNAQLQVRNSEQYKDAQRQSMFKRAQNNIDAYNAMRNDPSRATRAQRLRYALQGGLGKDKDARRERSFARNSQIAARGQAENVETARIAMRQSTGNYNTEIMGNQLSEYLDRLDAGETLSEVETNNMQALATQLAVQSGGAKQITEALRKTNADGTKGDYRDGRSMDVFGEYMSRDDKVRTAVEKKSQRVASRLGDIAAGVVSSSQGQAAYDASNNQYMAYLRQQRAAGRQAASFDDWRRTTEATTGHPIDSTTVVQNIARNVLDKDKDFVTQSGSEVRELVQHISQDRVDKMASNPNLFSYGDVAEGVEQTVTSRASAPYVDTAGQEVKIANIRRDSTGAVTDYSINDGSGTGWFNVRGNMAGYQTKADYDKAPKIIGTRRLQNRITDETIEVDVMSDNRMINRSTKADLQNPGAWREVPQPPIIETTKSAPQQGQPPRRQATEPPRRQPIEPPNNPNPT